MDEEETSGLGLGLNALFDEENSESLNVNTDILEEKTKIEKSSSAQRKRQTLPIEDLYPSHFQPRKVFDEDRIHELASSIEQYGVLQPLLVREYPEGSGSYDIIAGERRWRAAQRAKLHEVPVVVLDIDELEAFKIALIENLQREDLDPMDEAMGYQKLLEDFGQTQDSLAKAVGRSRPHITNMVRLLTLPYKVQDYLSSGDLSMGHARALITADDPAALAKQVISKGLSVRQTEKLATSKKKTQQGNQVKSLGSASDAMPKQEKDADTLALEKDMSNALGMNVNIDSADGKTGKLSIEFKSLDQLDELLHRLAHFPNNRLDG